MKKKDAEGTTGTHGTEVEFLSTGSENNLVGVFYFCYYLYRNLRPPGQLPQHEASLGIGGVPLVVVRLDHRALQTSTISR